MSVDPQSTDNSALAPWLSIVGVGADGVLGLSQSAQRAIAGATLVAGGARQLALVEPLIRGERLVWPSPLALGIAALLARRGQPTCVLASGDPFFYGIGATLAPSLQAGEFVCLPAPSSLSLAAARLAWALQDTEIVSLHGRDLSAVIRYLQPGRRVLALSWDRRTPAQLAALLCARGLGDTRLHVLERLGDPRERVRACLAGALDLGEVDDLNVVGLELPVSTRAFTIPSRASLPDSAFEHDGQLTKQDVRALTLSALAPYPGALLWDIGAGAGSIGIEWMLSHPACRTHAVERDPVRCARIRTNAAALGVPTLALTEAEAPAGLAQLPTPDAIFIGGGGGDRALFEHCWQALRPGGRLVINSVSLQTEALLIALHDLHGGELRRFAVESAVQLGTMTGWRAAMPVVQWRISKP
jgi:precorrin-6B C5,15-methyltransferase / cobalt-precorrin-6B C5,C15-methyltransferase